MESHRHLDRPQGLEHSPKLERFELLELEFEPGLMPVVVPNQPAFAVSWPGDAENPGQVHSEKTCDVHPVGGRTGEFGAAD